MNGGHAAYENDLDKTLSNRMPHRATAGPSPLTGSVFSRGLAFHTLAHSNRDQNRDFWNGTVTETVTNDEGGALSAGRGPVWGPRRWYGHPRLASHKPCVSHGSTGCGSAHNPILDSRASDSSFSSSTFPGAYFRYHQQNPSRTSSRLSMRPSGSATSPSSRSYLFNARIHQSPEALNRCKGTGKRRI